MDGNFLFRFVFRHLLLPDDIFCAKNILSLYLAIIANPLMIPKLVVHCTRQDNVFALFPISQYQFCTKDSSLHTAEAYSNNGLTDVVV